MSEVVAELMCGIEIVRFFPNMHAVESILYSEDGGETIKVESTANQYRYTFLRPLFIKSIKFFFSLFFLSPFSPLFLSIFLHVSLCSLLLPCKERPS